jgi:hypothetical protein
VPDPLAQQNCAFARGTPAILLLRCRWHNHRTDARLATFPGQERPQQRFAVDRVSLGTPPTPGHGDRCGIDDVAFDAMRFEQAVDPEPVKSGLWMTMIPTELSAECCTFDRRRPSRSSSAAPSPRGIVCFDIFSLPGDSEVTSHVDWLSSRDAYRIGSSDRPPDRA